MVIVAAILAFFAAPVVLIVWFLTRRPSPPVAPAPIPLLPTKKCPDCAEYVQAEARVCRYCGFRFTAESSAR